MLSGWYLSTQQHLFTTALPDSVLADLHSPCRVNGFLSKQPSNLPLPSPLTTLTPTLPPTTPTPLPPLLSITLQSGPALHAEVGDTLVVVLKNNLDFPINMMPGGMHMDGGAPTVNPGDTYTARWALTVCVRMYD